MREQKLEITYISYSSLDELIEDEQVLVKEALNSTYKSYAPYSQFHVGAALRTESGIIVTGNNIENSAFSVCMCAERVALYTATTLYPTQKIKKIAIAAKAENYDFKQLTSPCGSCRQVMIEFEEKQKSPIKIIIYSKREIITFDSAHYLLPFSFNETMLKK